MTAGTRERCSGQAKLGSSLAALSRGSDGQNWALPWQRGGWGCLDRENWALPWQVWGSVLTGKTGLFSGSYGEVFCITDHRKFIQ